MDAFPLATLEARRAAAGDPYLEFLTVPDLSAGLYVLGAGAVCAGALAGVVVGWPGSHAPTSSTSSAAARGTGTWVR